VLASPPQNAQPSTNDASQFCSTKQQQSPGPNTLHFQQTHYAAGHSYAGVVTLMQ
jgi:hypothetical protein